MPSRVTRYSSRLHADISRLGRQNFTFEVIAERETQEELDAAEFRYVEEFNTREPHGYNLFAGGVRIYDDKTLQAFSEKAKLAHQDPVYRAKTYPKLKGRTPPNKGVPMSDDQRAKLSAIRIDLFAQGYTSPNLGKTRTPAQLENIRAAAERREADRRERGETHPNLGTKRTAEAREKMRAAKNPKPVFCETNGQTYPSARAAALALGLQPGNVAGCLRGRLKSTGGHRFRFA